MDNREEMNPRGCHVGKVQATPGGLTPLRIITKPIVSFSFYRYIFAQKMVRNPVWLRICLPWVISPPGLDFDGPEADNIYMSAYINFTYGLKPTKMSKNK